MCVLYAELFGKGFIHRAYMAFWAAAFSNLYTIDLNRVQHYQVIR